MSRDEAYGFEWQSSIRTAAPKDSLEIAKIHTLCWREAYAGILPPDYLASLSVENRSDMWASVLGEEPSEESTRVFLVEREGLVAGFGACGRQRDPALSLRGFDGEVGALYILHHAQSRGLGRRLMSKMAADLAARGIAAMALWVLADNLKAKRFYEGLRGVEVGVRVDVRPDISLPETAYGWTNLNQLTDLSSSGTGESG